MTIFLQQPLASLHTALTSGCFVCSIISPKQITTGRTKEGQPVPNTTKEVATQLQFGQWTLRLMTDDSYEFVNLGPDGEPRYYRIVQGKYGQPLIDQEPNDMALLIPGDLYYHSLNNGHVISPTREDKIIGVICRDGPRFSMTNAKNKGVKVIVNPDGSINVGDKTWWLLLLLCPDSQRFTPNRWVAYLVPKKPNFVLVGEMADLLCDWDARVSALSAK